MVHLEQTAPSGYPGRGCHSFIQQAGMQQDEQSSLVPPRSANHATCFDP